MSWADLKVGPYRCGVRGPVPARRMRRLTPAASGQIGETAVEVCDRLFEHPAMCRDTRPLEVGERPLARTRERRAFCLSRRLLGRERRSRCAHGRGSVLLCFYRLALPASRHVPVSRLRRFLPLLMYRCF